MKAVFPARLQPLHIGHKKAIENCLEKFENFILVIGSADKSRTEENPLTVEEREKLVRECFPDLQIETLDDETKDDEGNDKWVSKLIREFNPDVVISQNDLVKQLLDAKSGVEVFEQDLHSKEVYSGTEVRRRIRSGHEWRYLVPECSRGIMEDYLEIFEETGIQYEFNPGWKKENAFYGTDEDNF